MASGLGRVANTQIVERLRSEFVRVSQSWEVPELSRDLRTWAAQRRRMALLFIQHHDLIGACLVATRQLAKVPFGTRHVSETDQTSTLAAYYIDILYDQAQCELIDYDQPQCELIDFVRCWDC